MSKRASEAATNKLRIVSVSIARPGAPHGYGVVARGIERALAAHDRVEVLPAERAQEWDYVLLTAQPVLWLFPLGTGEVRHDLIWHTMFEVWPLVPGWANVLNRAAVIWTPSRWAEHLLRRAGVKRPIITVPYGVDHDIFYPVDRKARLMDEKRTMRFVAWGRGLVSRKHLLQAIRAFLMAGLPNATLEVKVNADDEVARGGIDITWRGRKVSPDRVRIIAEDWPRRKVADWLRSADCGIYLTGGEGFGLMPLEMMATGLPVILQVNTGVAEYATADNCLPITVQKPEAAFTYKNRFGYECYWWKPDVQSVRDAIAWAYHHRANIYERGVRGYHTARQYTWARTAHQFVAALQDVMRNT